MTNIFDGILPRPKTEVGKGVHVIIAIAIMVVSAWLIISKVDLILNTGGPLGYIFDLGMFIIFVSVGLRLYSSLKGRLTMSRQTLKKHIKKFSLVKLILSFRFWISIAFMVVAINYLAYVYDLIPDNLGWIGRIDDIGFILVALKDMINSWNRVVVR